MTEYVRHRDRTPQEKMREFIDKSPLVPNPMEILGNDCSPELIKLYGEVRRVSDRLMTAILDNLASREANQ